jgi:hypothetical protein
VVVAKRIGLWPGVERASGTTLICGGWPSHPTQNRDEAVQAYDCSSDFAEGDHFGR